MSIIYVYFLNISCYSHSSVLKFISFLSKLLSNSSNYILNSPVCVSYVLQIKTPPSITTKNYHEPGILAPCSQHPHLEISNSNCKLFVFRLFTFPDVCAFIVSELCTFLDGVLETCSESPPHHRILNSNLSIICNDLCPFFSTHELKSFWRYPSFEVLKVVMELSTPTSEFWIQTL